MDEKTTAKKQVKNTTEKGIRQNKSESDGLKVLTNYEKNLLQKELPKIKWVGVGVCPQCGKELVRDAECDLAVCMCSSVVKVDLTLAAILPPKLEKYFNDLAKQCGCTVDDIFNKCFEVGFENLERRLEKGVKVC